MRHHSVGDLDGLKVSDELGVKSTVNLCQAPRKEGEVKREAASGAMMVAEDVGEHGSYEVVIRNGEVMMNLDVERRRALKGSQRRGDQHVRSLLGDDEGYDGTNDMDG